MALRYHRLIVFFHSLAVKCVRRIQVYLFVPNNTQSSKVTRNLIETEATIMSYVQLYYVGQYLICLRFRVYKSVSLFRQKRIQDIRKVKAFKGHVTRKYFPGYRLQVLHKIVTFILLKFLSRSSQTTKIPILEGTRPAFLPRKVEEIYWINRQGLFHFTFERNSIYTICLTHFLFS